MIESITIANVAAFGATPEVLNGHSQLNYVFGSNGTGKTTIRRVIADETRLPMCSVEWRGGTKLQPLVYNRDFIGRNFNQSAELKGIFTLDAQQLDTLEKIATAEGALDALSTRIETLTHDLQGAHGNGGKRGELATLEAGFKDKCWVQKQIHDTNLRGGFEGFRSSSEKFKGKVIQEQSSNTAALLTLAELEKKAESVFVRTPTMDAPSTSVDTSNVLAHETNPILKKRVIGKEDVDIAAMINKLGNSDWVRVGRGFYEVNDHVCPFCQQETTEAFANNLNEYFDEAFVADSKAIDDLASDYTTDAARIQR